MRKCRLLYPFLLSVSILASNSGAAEERTGSDPFRWPQITQQAKPWTRWWWLGSAVDETNLTRQLTEFRDAGFGGVEICPIYGAKGYEDRYIDFLSPKWMDMLAYTIKEAHRLGLGADLTTGTGWPFGGPHVNTNDASSRVNMQPYELSAGESLNAPLLKGRLQTLIAFSGGQWLDLTAKVNDGKLDWVAPAGNWKLYAMALDGPVQKVKRAGPGGTGNVLDPFCVPALNRYLAGFDNAFADYREKMPRCFFQDSYEYYNADGEPEIFRDFKRLRGYDLRTQLPAVFGEGDPDTVARVKGDYRETLGDLHLEFVRRWTAWAHSRGSFTREQAHGGPGNLIDTYAAADIPEMEIFAGYNESGIPMMKFAASAAHLTGHTLASSESFTWLTEHFQASLAQVKPAADFLFLSGINHIFFHGIPYSPAEAPWPGWQFYASVNFGPEGGLWHDLPEFNAYVSRCQSILQSGKPSNNVLLYVPFHDKWQMASGNLLMNFETSGQWMESEPFYQTAMTLWKRGYAFDEISDRLIEQARVKDGKIVIGGNSYRVLLLPKMRLIPETTLRKAIALAREGATVVVEDKLPEDVPGLFNLNKRRAELKKLLKVISPSGAGNNTVSRAAIGKGQFLYGAADALMQTAGVPREECIDAGLRFVRRSWSRGYHYFFVNSSEKSVDTWFTLGTQAKSAIILDPYFSNHVGVAALRQSAGGATQVYLQLLPGQSCILRTLTNSAASGPTWSYYETNGTAQPLEGNWSVRFIEGGPELPKSFETRKLATWTEQDDPEAKRFAGTARYTIEFDAPAGVADDWILDLRPRLRRRTRQAQWSRRRRVVERAVQNRRRQIPSARQEHARSRNHEHRG